LKLVQDFAAEMSNWTRSNISREQLLRLVEAGQLPPLTEAIEWIVPAGESVPRPPNGYVVSFVAFHERGFSVPAGRFIREVLFAYGLQLQHLNPNSIQQMAAFVAMCEGFLGISAHWHLFWYFFRFTCVREGSRAVTISCSNLRMKQGRGDDYIPAADQLEQWLAQTMVLLAERPRACASGVHRLLHCEIAKELAGQPCQDRAREGAQVPLGRAKNSYDLHIRIVFFKVS
jgi:hypothetical protein